MAGLANGGHEDFTGVTLRRWLVSGQQKRVRKIGICRWCGKKRVRKCWRRWRINPVTGTTGDYSTLGLNHFFRGGAGGSKSIERKKGKISSELQ